MTTTMKRAISMVNVHSDNRVRCFFSFLFLHIASPDEGWSMGTHVLLAIHLIFVNILLTNLLIAMFRLVVRSLFSRDFPAI